MAKQKAWFYQRKAHIAKYGEKEAAWIVSWYEPSGRLKSKSCGPGKIGNTAAKKLAEKLHVELSAGTYKSDVKATWKYLRSEYESKIASRFDHPSRQAAEMALNNFERVAKPKNVAFIDTDLIDGYVSKRLKERAQRRRKATDDDEKPKDVRLVSPATINKELRYVRSILNLAKEWKLIDGVPKVRFLKVVKKLPTYIPAEHFKPIYVACEVATAPTIPNVPASIWWRSLITMGYMTGWRISQLLNLRWEDVDLDRGFAITQAEVVGNKGGRDERIPLHPIIVSHLKQLVGSFDEYVFPWNQTKRTLWFQFQAIQSAAKLPDGSSMPKQGKRGGWYGFHDLRRGFATLNAESMDLFELQGLMQHKSLETTKTYVNMARRYNETVKNLYVPDGLQISDVG